MEVFMFYQTFFNVCVMLGMDMIKGHFVGIGLGVAAWVALFLLQGFGLRKMAKRKNMQKRALAFIPFANIWYMGKITGECQFFSQKVKRMGLFVMLAQIVATLFSMLVLAAMTYLFVVEGAPSLTDDYGVWYWGGSGFSAFAEQFYSIGAGNNMFGISIMSILQLVYEILMLILLMGLYKKYTPKNYIFLSILSIFVPEARFIIVFCLRNKTEIDYAEYIRQRREAATKAYQQYYGTGYGTPYGGGYPNGNPYAQPNVQPNAQPQKPEDPFGEFEGDKETKNVAENPTPTPNPNNDGFFD